MKPRLESPAGFTLLELIVALSLSVFVLIGVISIATSMISYQLDAARHGSAEGMALVAETSLARDIRDATYIAQPLSGTGNTLAGCTNWSNVIGGADKRLNPGYSGSTANGDECTGGNNVMSFYYCASASNQLVRYVSCGTSCSPPAPGSCGGGAGGANMTVIVPSYPGFYHMDTLNYFFERADDSDGVGLHYIVGVGTPTATVGKAQVRMPVSYKFNVRISGNKSYNNPSD